jgi:hypothetical protein
MDERSARRVVGWGTGVTEAVTARAADSLYGSANRQIRGIDVKQWLSHPRRMPATGPA